MDYNFRLVGQILVKFLLVVSALGSAWIIDDYKCTQGRSWYTLQLHKHLNKCKSTIKLHVKAFSCILLLLEDIQEPR